HKGSYYGFSSGDTGKVKIVGKDYIDFSKDKATIIKFGGE
ncbi:CRISPR-associated protein Csm4, partial [Listeria monocytogenes]|nr:CRISPR-associated protein Csm4 [Listeria monocytogenes]EAH3445972.1 CRISPR-associated protein Csm4 [Listeria monocytogenes]